MNKKNNNKVRFNCKDFDQIIYVGEKSEVMCRDLIPYDPKQISKIPNGKMELIQLKNEQAVFARFGLLLSSFTWEVCRCHDGRLALVRCNEIQSILNGLNGHEQSANAVANRLPSQRGIHWAGRDCWKQD